MNVAGIMAEIRQAVDGAAQIEDDAILLLIGTANKDTKQRQFPKDLLHRLLLQVDFGDCPIYSPSRHGFGFNYEQRLQFWNRNAQCLPEARFRLFKSHAS